MSDRHINPMGMRAAFAALALVLAAPAMGQTGAAKDENPAAAAMNGVEQRFLATAPDVGKSLPADLEVYTAAGEKRPLQSLLMGHPTVLVLGCLT